MMTNLSSAREIQHSISRALDSIFDSFFQQDKRISDLEAIFHAVINTQLEDKLLNVREAADYLRVQPDSIRKARRLGRIKGIPTNEKEWGFYQSELDRYLKRHNRAY